MGNQRAASPEWLEKVKKHRERYGRDENQLLWVDLCDKVKELVVEIRSAMLKGATIEEIEMRTAKLEGLTVNEVVDEAGRRGYYDGPLGELMARGTAAEAGALEETPEELEERLFHSIEIHTQKFGRDELNDTGILDDEKRKEFLHWERKNPFPTAS